MWVESLLWGFGNNMWIEDVQNGQWGDIYRVVAIAIGKISGNLTQNERLVTISL